MRELRARIKEDQRDQETEKEALKREYAELYREFKKVCATQVVAD